VKEESGQGFISYASGRQNVAWVDLKLRLHRRYNPLSMIGEYIVGFSFESYSASMEKIEASLIPLGGREGRLVPVGGGKLSQHIIEQRNNPSVSGYDNLSLAPKITRSGSP
jgi:hypothetical protein